MSLVIARGPARRLRVLTCAIVAAVQLAAAGAAVEPKAPSKTAIWVAAGRAIGAKHPNEQYRNPDYLAIKFVGPRERAILSDYPLDALDMDLHRLLPLAAKREERPDGGGYCTAAVPARP